MASRPPIFLDESNPNLLTRFEGGEMLRINQRGKSMLIDPSVLYAAGGMVPPLDKMLRTMRRAGLGGIYDTANYGSGPTAGLTVPTLTWITAPAAVTAKPQRKAMNDVAGNDFAAYYGGLPIPVSGSSYGFAATSSTVGRPTAGARAGVLFSIEIMTDEAAPCFELGYSGATQYRLFVDDQFMPALTVNGTAVPARSASPMPNVNSGGFQALQVDFGSRSSRGRKLRLELELNTLFRAVLVGNDSTVWKPTPDSFTRMTIQGDSFIAGCTDANVPGSFGGDNAGSVLGKMLGVTDVWHLAVAGTGISTDSALGNRYGSAERLADLQIVRNLPGGIDLHVIEMSINDRLVAPATVQADLQVLLRATRDILGPTTPILVLGCSSGSYGPAALAPVEQAGKDAITAFGDPLVGFAPFSTRAPIPALTGTENVSNSTGAGNAGRLIRNDGVHPTFSAIPVGGGTGGMEYHGSVWAQGGRSALTAMRR